MGFLGGLANVAGLQMANIEANPEQAAVGANTPESTYALNKTVAPTLDKHYTPTVNMMGGATQCEMQQNAAQGYSNTGPMAANAIGNAAAMYFTGGAATPLVAGQMAADRYSANNPNSTFDREYNGRINAANANINAGINATNNNVNASLNAGVNQGYTLSRYRSGGLAEAAKHLERQGRGQDSHLVHMTTGELKALQKMAEQHGGSLTVNPHTGLPEAGFLSSILPMVAGAAMVALAPETGGLSLLADPMVAGGIVGAADWAMTGSLKQGIMAGLGAWGGASLAGGLGNLGLQGAAESGGDTAAKEFAAAQSQAIGAGGSTLPEGVVPTESGAFNTITGTEVTPQSVAQDQIAKMSNLTAQQQSAFQQALQTPGANTSDLIRSAGAANAAAGAGPASSLANMGRGLTSGNVMSMLGNNLGATATVATPFLADSGLFKQPTVPGATQQTSNNPFGMKTIPKDANGNPIFHASVPTPPNPPYQAQYRDYVANPYIAGAKKGGLMDIPKYSGADYGSMVTGANEMQQGLAQATSPQQLSELQKELIAAGQESSKNGVYHLSDIEYAKLNPTNVMKSHKIAIAKGIQPVGALGDYETTPAAQAAAAAQADIEKASQQQTSAKEGGLMAMASGGSTDHVYHPQYQNYAQQQYQPQVSGGIPVPTRSAGIPPQGYKIDPMQMVGSPAYNQHQADLAAQQAQQQSLTQQIMAAANQSSNGGASGGLPKDFKHKHIQDGHLGSFSDGGRLLKGPGDGVSDGIPAVIGGKQPARLADGEFVIPARIVSELGNGSTDAGAKRLYAMMDRINHARKKSKDIAADTKAYKYLPA